MTLFERIIIALVALVALLELFQVLLRGTIVNFLKGIHDHLNKDN